MSVISHVDDTVPPGCHGHKPLVMALTDEGMTLIPWFSLTPIPASLGLGFRPGNGSAQREHSRCWMQTVRQGGLVPSGISETAPTAQILLRKEERKGMNSMSCKHIVFALLLLLDWLTISKGIFAVSSDFILLKRGKKSPQPNPGAHSAYLFPNSNALN